MVELTWKEAIAEVLADADEALHYTEIAERIATRGLRTNLGATPAQTVNAQLGRAGGRFIKTGRGTYMLGTSEAGTPRLAAASLGPLASPQAANASEEEADAAPILKSIGIFWNIARIDWTTRPRLLGQQQFGSATVDFSEQIGVYVLYDGNRPVYAGRSIDRPISTRLKEHLRDRLNGRWNRFSWFGLKGVDDTGHLTEADFTADQRDIVVLMEGILIETLEPPLNRKRGDDFSAREYLQVDDSGLEERRFKETVEALWKGRRD